MKKRNLISLLSAGTCALAFAMPVHAEDYSNTDAWVARCSQPQSSADGVKACQAFQDYQQQRYDQLQEDIKQYSKDIASLEEDTDKMEQLAKTQKELQEQLEGQIQEKESAIQKIEEEIKALEQKIQEKQEEIDAWDEQIKSRMQNEQSSTGTNMLIDLVMGSQDLNDMLRRLSGIERITEDDQHQIEQLNELKEQLDLQKSEQVRLEEETKSQQDQLKSQQQQAKELEESYNQLVEQYEQQMAQLQAAKRAAFNDIESIRSNMISVSYSGTLVNVAGFVSPITGGRMSAGTWAYPGGGLHLGMDYAVPIGTQVVAPADGVILYANNPAPSNGGYLGNWTGYPYGGGNTIEMVCMVNGTTYAVSFAHLSREGFAVSAGQSVSQGQAIALTGNSGNSSGPHCHIEVYNLGNMSLEEAVSRFSSSADFAWGTGWNSTATACENGYSTPCRERPEKFFG